METNSGIKKVQQLRIVIICCCFLNMSIIINGQAQKTWQWVKQLGGRFWDISAGIACDSKNNLYLAGSFYDTLNCDLKKISSAGNRDIFIARFTEQGDLKDILTCGGKGPDMVTCICTVPDDNVALGGILTDSADFDKTKIPGKGQRLFAAIFDEKGKFTWVSTISVTGDASLFMIGADEKGSIYVSGVFNGTLQADNKRVISNGRNDVFIARFDRTGAPEELISFGSEEDDIPGSMSVDASGNTLLAGTFIKSFEAGGIELSPGSTKTNVFIIMFDRDFNSGWAKALSGDDYVQVSSIKSDNTGSFFTAGNFSSKLKIADTALVSQGYTDGFILKFHPDGSLAWGRSFGSWYYDYSNYLITDNPGGAIVSGSIGDIMTIDSIIIKPESKINSYVVIQFDAKGKAIWADCISGSGRNFSTGSVVDNKGNLYFAGSFRNRFEKDGDALISNGDQDIFIAKYYNCLSSKAEITGQLSFCPGYSTELSVKKSFNNIVWNDTIPGKYSIEANKPGKYWVRMLDKKGCLLTDTVILTQNDLPVFSLGNDTSIMVTDSLLLRAPDNYPVYIWHDNSTHPTFMAKTADGKAGTIDYWLTVTDSLSCNYSDTISINYLMANDRINLEGIQLIAYPNPATDRIYWYLNTDETFQFVIELTDLKGSKLYRRIIKYYSPGETNEISLEKIPAGIYYLRISNLSNGVNINTVRVIKQ